MKVRFQQQSEHSECGLASATMLIDYFIKKINLPKLRERYGVPNGGYNLAQIQSVLSDYGVYSKPIRINAESIPAVPTPFIAFWDKKHFLVVEKVTKSYIYIVDPALGKTKLTLDEFKLKFSNIVLYSTNDGHRKKTFWKVNQTIKECLHKNSGLIMGAFSITCVAQCFSLVVPYTIQTIIDGKYSMYGHYTQFLFGIILLILCYFLANMIKIRVFVKLQTSIDSDLLGKTIYQLLNLPYSYFVNRSKGELIYRINSNSYIRQVLVDQVIELILNSIFFIVYLIAMFMFSSILTMLTLFVTFILVIFAVINAKVNQKILQNQMVVMTKSQDMVSELINNIFTIKATNSHQYIYKKWRCNFSEQVEMERKKAKYSSYLTNIPLTIQNSYPLIIFFFGYFLSLQNQITIGGVIAFNAIGILFLSPVLSITGIYNQLLMVKVYLDRLLDILETQTENTVGKKELNDYSGNISLNKVSYRYSQFSKNAITDISLSISSNEKIAIVGASGSGKSTLLKLMASLYHPVDGEIYYDSIDISNIQVHQLREHIGVVLQENVLFSGSLRDNILMGRKYSDESIMESIKLANLEELLTSFPLGLETRISESGYNLSGGQRQKISIARTILSKPKIIFMDEPTSSLDNISEKIVMENLFKSTSTLIIAAHRLSMIQQFDKVIVMNQGKIVAIGTHEDLLQCCSYYQKLYEVSNEPLKMFSQPI